MVKKRAVYVTLPAMVGKQISILILLTLFGLASLVIPEPQASAEPHEPCRTLFTVRDYHTENVQEGVFPAGVSLDLPPPWRLEEEGLPNSGKDSEHSPAIRASYLTQKVFYQHENGVQSDGSMSLGFADGTLYLFGVFLRKHPQQGLSLPVWVQAGMPLVKGKGQPLFMYLVWRYLIRQNILPHKIQRVIIKNVHNLETIIEYTQQREAWRQNHRRSLITPALHAKFLEGSKFVRLWRATLMQLRRRVSQIQMDSNDQGTSLKSLLFVNESYGSHAQQEELIESSGLDPALGVPINFDILMQVSPQEDSAPE